MQNPITAFNSSNPIYNYNPPSFQKKILDPNEICVVENCFNKRIITPDGKKLVICSPECERKFRGFSPLQ